MSFRDNLQHLRASRNMTQEQLAMLVGVSRQSVTKWEAERAYPEMDKLLKLCQIFDCSLDDLVSGDLTAREEDVAAPGVPAGPPTDVCGYDEHTRRFAFRIATGVSLFIFAAASTALVAALLGLTAADLQIDGDTVSVAGEGVAAIPFLVLVAVGLVLVIPAGLERSAFRREHPYIEDFYTSEQRAGARSLFSRSLVVGIAVLVLSMIPPMVYEGTSFEDLAGGILLALCAVGVWPIVYGSLMAGRVNVARYNRTSLEEIADEDIDTSNLTAEQKERLVAGRRSPRGARKRKAERVCGIIMLSATALGLLWLFAAEALGAPGELGNYFWLPWPIGGIACAVAGIVIEGSSE